MKVCTAFDTRSQAVARVVVADRTAKNCRCHVTEATPTFREIICAHARHSQYKATYQTVFELHGSQSMPGPLTCYDGPSLFGKFRVQRGPPSAPSLLCKRDDYDLV